MTRSCTANFVIPEECTARSITGKIRFLVIIENWETKNLIKLLGSCQTCLEIGCWLSIFGLDVTSGMVISRQNKAILRDIFWGKLLRSSKVIYHSGLDIKNISQYVQWILFILDSRSSKVATFIFSFGVTVLLAGLRPLKSLFWSLMFVWMWGSCCLLCVASGGVHACGLVSAYGGVCGWRLQAHTARPAAALRQTEGQWEEQEALWAARSARVQPGKETRDTRTLSRSISMAEKGGMQPSRQV